MPSKQFQLDESTTVIVYKRSSSKSLRLTISSTGQIKVSIPAWAPYRSGVLFAKSRLEWIHKQRQPKRVLLHGDQIGKEHRLLLLASSSSKKVSSRVIGSDVIIKFPAELGPQNESVQKIASQASIRALRSEAEAILPKRLAELASRYDFEYGSVSVKKMVSRWGSCDQHKNIVLNLYLMQLPWECIDYVLLHELTHTRIMQHGKVFWQEMALVVPRLTAVRKAMRSYQPAVHGASIDGVS